MNGKRARVGRSRSAYDGAMIENLTDSARPPHRDPGSGLIVNCLPINDGERREFLRAAPGISQEFTAGLADAKRMMWQAHVPPQMRARTTVIIGNAPVEEVRRCPRLQWLQTFSAGVDAYTPAGVLPPGAMLTGASGAYGQSVSEHMFAMMWALMKRIPEYRDRQHECVWNPGGIVLTPQGATVLVIGTGDIGSHFARLASAVGAHTVGVRRHVDQPAEGIDEMHGCDELDALLPTADVVALAVPATQATRHMIDARRLSLMARRAVLLNVGRGDAIDCTALADALHRGVIAAAGLDVTDPEPLPESHPLWGEARCLITPHVAGGIHLAVTGRRIIAIALDNLRRYVSGRLLRNLVH